MEGWLVRELMDCIARSAMSTPASAAISTVLTPLPVVLKTGKIVEGAICYTGDILDPNEKKYTLDYYVRKAKELEAMGCHIFALKDMAGGSPYSVFSFHFQSL